MLNRNLRVESRFAAEAAIVIGTLAQISASPRRNWLLPETWKSTASG